MQTEFPIVYDNGGGERRQALQRRVQKQASQNFKLALHLLIVEELQAFPQFCYMSMLKERNVGKQSNENFTFTLNDSYSNQGFALFLYFSDSTVDV